MIIHQVVAVHLQSLNVVLGHQHGQLGWGQGWGGVWKKEIISKPVKFKPVIIVLRVMTFRYSIIIRSITETEKRLRRNTKAIRTSKYIKNTFKWVVTTLVNSYVAAVLLKQQFLPVLACLLWMMERARVGARVLNS